MFLAEFLLRGQSYKQTHQEQPFLVSWEGGEGLPHPCFQPSSSIKGPVLQSKCSPSKRSSLPRCPMSTESWNTWEPVPHTFSDGNLADIVFSDFESMVTSASKKKKKGWEITFNPEQQWVFPYLERKLSISVMTTLNFLPTLFSSVAQSCLTLCDPMNCSTPGLLSYTVEKWMVGAALHHLQSKT